LRGYLALVFLQAAFGHLGSNPVALAALWTPRGVFAPIAHAALANPRLFVDSVIAIEFALGASMVAGLLTRVAGLGGFVLNIFFFAAFEWSDTGQLYLSWDAALAALWLLVILWAPGRVLGLGAILARRWPRWAPILE
jgi:uncharacterized membrane protein YphA (DoxX/SURF4 family)